MSTAAMQELLQFAAIGDIKVAYNFARYGLGYNMVLRIGTIEKLNAATQSGREIFLSRIVRQVSEVAGLRMRY